MSRENSNTETSGASDSEKNQFPTPGLLQYIDIQP